MLGRKSLALRARTEIYPGSESGTCFRTNRSCRLSPAHQGMKIGLRWLVEVSWVSLVPPLDSGFRRTDECGAGGIQALLRLRNIIFVPIAHAGRRRHTKV